MPWHALVLVRECYDPTDYGPEDEVELVDEGDGVVVTKRKDWFRHAILLMNNLADISHLSRLATIYCLL